MINPAGTIKILKILSLPTHILARLLYSFKSLGAFQYSSYKLVFCFS